MTMQTVQFNASEPLEDYVPEDAEIVSITYSGNTEEVEYRVPGIDTITCEECGEQFDSQNAYAGHKSKHS
jgi:hypothetical protein